MLCFKRAAAILQLLEALLSEINRERLKERKKGVNEDDTK
jgi:hypothetical protein